MNSKFAVDLFILIKKYVFKFNIVTVNMTISNPLPSKKKKKEKRCQKKLLISGVVVMTLIWQ